MTREEAIAVLRREIEPSVYEDEKSIAEAIDMAIEALSANAEDIKWIAVPKDEYEQMIETPSVVRCKDCIQKHIGGSVTQYYWCDRWDMEVDDTDYCAWGERREE